VVDLKSQYLYQENFGSILHRSSHGVSCIRGKTCKGYFIMKLSRVVWVSGIGCSVFVLWCAYSYFFDMVVPQIDLVGIAHDAHYAGDVPCMLKTDKRGTLSVLLDNKPLPVHCFSKSKSCEYPFVIPVATLSNGPHALQVTFQDNTYHHTAAHADCTFYVDNAPLYATLVHADTEGRVPQGHTVHIQFQTNKPIKCAQAQALCRQYPCIAESPGSLVYECFIPIACEEQPNGYIATVEVRDHVNNVVHLDYTFTVTEYPFKKQVIRVDQEKVKKEQEAGPSEKEFEALLARLTESSPAVKHWQGPFCTPIDIQRVTCEFGTLRTSQYKGRYAHKALDVINNDPHSVVWAPHSGVVVVKDRFAISGNTIVLDHGCGIFSLLFHLADFADDVMVGEMIRQGNPVGIMGNTGHATGCHLHWETRVCNVPVEPMEWTKANF